MKFCGNTSYWSRVVKKNFHQVMAEQERFFIKMVRIHEHSQNHTKSPIFIGTSKIIFVIFLLFHTCRRQETNISSPEGLFMSDSAVYYFK
jgi:hypothetical protein